MGSDGMARGAPFGEAVGAASTTTSPRLPRRVRLAFGAGIGGSTIVDRIVFMWLYYFWVRGAVEGGQAYVPPVLFGVIVFGGRVLDAVTDPVVARWSDNHRGRLGRRRPFLLGSGHPYVVAGAVLFFPPVRGRSTWSTSSSAWLSSPWSAVA